MNRSLEFDDLDIGERFTFDPSVRKFNTGACIKRTDSTYVVLSTDREFRQVDPTAKVIRTNGK
jgi:hypothetical protein